MAYTITKPPVIIEAWGSQSTITTDYIVPPTSAGSTVQSQDKGWTPIYEEDLPPEGSGLEITRQQMNGVLNLYSSHNFWLQAGGTYTFEQNISDACGGYPLGQVLWSSFNETFQISLMNNNTANFVTNHAYLNDGVHWRQVTVTRAQLNDNILEANFLTLSQDNSPVTTDIDFTSIKSASGYQYINGLLIQWWSVGIDANTTVDIPYPFAFPSNGLQIFATIGHSIASGYSYAIGGSPLNSTHARVTLVASDGVNHQCRFVAIGF